MATYSLITNGESGFDVRTTLNSIIGDLNNGVYTSLKQKTGFISGSDPWVYDSGLNESTYTITFTNAYTLANYMIILNGVAPGIIDASGIYWANMTTAGFDLKINGQDWSGGSLIDCYWFTTELGEN